MGARRMLALINGLPEDAAVWRPDKKKWTQQDELLAQLTELVDAWGRRATYAALIGASKFRLNQFPDFPEPVLGPIEHPDRPRRRQPDGEGAATPATGFNRAANLRLLKGGA